MGQMQGRVCVITGGNAGIGRATAVALAERGATVVILCRSRERGERARAEIATESGNDRVELVVADLAVQDEVRLAAAELLRRHAKIHVVINNAAVLLPKREVTVDGIEKTFATNYLSHFLLTNLLLDRLKASAPARVINVATLIRGATIDLDDLGMERRKYSSFGALGPSKLALILFTRELAERLAGTRVTVNALHPGLVRTTIMEGQPWLVKKLVHLLSTTPQKGARAPVFLASDPRIVGVTGQLFAKGRAVRMSGAQVDDEGLRKRLWERSALLSGLTRA